MHSNYPIDQGLLGSLPLRSLRHCLTFPASTVRYYRLCLRQFTIHGSCSSVFRYLGRGFGHVAVMRSRIVWPLLFTARLVYFRPRFRSSGIFCVVSKISMVKMGSVSSLVTQDRPYSQKPACVVRSAGRQPKNLETHFAPPISTFRPYNTKRRVQTSFSTSVRGLTSKKALTTHQTATHVLES